MSVQEDVVVPLRRPSITAVQLKSGAGFPIVALPVMMFDYKNCEMRE